MTILRADALGLCFGVRDALDLADRLDHPERVTIHGQLVHNPLVQQRLAARGFASRDESDRQAAGHDPRPVVLLTAHGVSDRERARLRAGGQRLVDATCPLVRKAHAAALRLAADGFHVIVIGQRAHVEVVGLTEDLPSHTVVGRPEDVATYPHARLGIVCQTTTATREALAIRRAIERLNPHAEIRYVDTICQPTKDRQQALERLLDQVDAVVVVGGPNSNNTRQLVARCAARGVRAAHVQGPEDLRPEWFADVDCVGLTAGTSTLDETVEAVHAALLRIAAAQPRPVPCA